MSSFPKLTCCGGNPYSCQHFYNAKACPTGLVPQFCCNINGNIVPALINQDDSGNITPGCSFPGDVPYTSYDASACMKSPVFNCCDEGDCYQSKSSSCQYFGNGIAAPGGNVVSNCSLCTPAANATCCFPGQFCQQAQGQSCDQGSYQVPDCSFCPY